VAQVTASYQEHLDRMSRQSAGQVGVDPIQAQATSAPQGYATLRQVKVSCDGQVGTELHAISERSQVDITFSFDSDPSMPAPSGAIAVTAADGRMIASCGSWIDGVALQRDSQGSGTVNLRIENLPLLKGRYGLSAYLFCERGLHIYTAAEGVASLNVTQENVEQGLFHMPRAWHFEPGVSSQIASPPSTPATPSTH
jgi:lipopolysaccharide transport system ATP-binding protein